jgi:glycosyltransferase involved in cell wall biosynthesis
LKKILIISHDASRSGAPILLLNILEAYHERNPNVEIDIVVKRNGPLIHKFKKIGSRVLVLNNDMVFPSSRFSEFTRKSKLRVLSYFYKKRLIELALKDFVSKDYDLIFSNTITNGAVLNFLQPFNCKVLTYVHELESAIHAWTDTKTLSDALKFTDHFLVPSKAVSVNLTQNYNIPTSQIDLLHYYVPELYRSIELKAINSLSRNKTMMIGSIGTLEWRKGADLFIQVALLIKKKCYLSNIKFIWVGVDKENDFYKQIKDLICLAGLSEDIELVEKVSNPFDYLSMIDILLLPSREDPYPLIVLEAAMLKKAIISFDKTGGASEFLSEGCGIVVPFPDVEAMAKEIKRLLQNKSERDLYGERARRKYLQLHSRTNALNAFETILDKYKS